MKTYTSEELNNILERHKKWLNDEEGGARADLSCANLSGANLRGSNLRRADLRGADLSLAIGEMKSLRSMQIEKYMISYTDKILNIGCKSYTIEEWKNFNDETISRMDSGALEWWKKWKPIIMQIIEMSPAEPTGYVEEESK